MKAQPKIDRSAWPADCPRPAENIKDLGFKRQPMVDWLAPAQLASTGIQAVLSSIFGSYADKREVQAALNPGAIAGAEIYAASYDTETASEGFWVDYCADIGDGFRPTYTMAWLMGRESLSVQLQNESLVLPRGRVLVLGGDQVYPTAKREEYDNRLVGPFRAALPYVEVPRNPNLFAIPGNHDWYDGLTSFLRLFCQRRWIGGWKTLQRRSYFAIRLPHNWWIWGTDLQLGTDVDQPQLDYFRKVAHQMRQDAGTAEPRVILCTAQPSWVSCDELEVGKSVPPRHGCRHAVNPDAFSSLDFLQRETLAPNGIHLAAILSGDLHHYVHYHEVSAGADGGLHLITSGGGGAYLYPTHHLPERLAIAVRDTTPSQSDTRTRTFEQSQSFPDAADSRRLGHGSWFALPWRNRGFALLIAGLYLLYAWMIQSESKRGRSMFDWWPAIARERRLSEDVPASLMDLLAQLRLTDLAPVTRAFWDVLRHSPANVVFGLALIAGLWMFRRAEKPARWMGVSGAVHGALHLLLCFALIWAFSWLNVTLMDLRVEQLVQIGLFSAEMFIMGQFLGGWLFGLYMLLASDRTGAHLNEVYSAQGLTSFKNFLRMHFAADGSLSIHALGVRETPEVEAWRYRGGDAGLKPGDPWFDIDRDQIKVELIERIQVRVP